LGGRIVAKWKSSQPITFLEAGSLMTGKVVNRSHFGILDRSAMEKLWADHIFGPWIVEESKSFEPITFWESRSLQGRKVLSGSHFGSLDR
jgi:hypothetical protein